MMPFQINPGQSRNDALKNSIESVNKLNDSESKNLMNKWGISFRANTINTDYNEGIDE